MHHGEEVDAILSSVAAFYSAVSGEEMGGGRDLQHASFDYALYSDTQRAVLSYLSLATAPLSVMGLATIIYVIFKDKHTRIRASERLVLGMSIYDLLSSIGLILLGPWAMPKEVSHYVTGARAPNFRACAASGFFLHLMFGSMWYSFFMAIDNLLKVRYSWTSQQFAKYIEPFAHGLAFLATALVGTIALVENWFNPLYVLPGWSWFQPMGCIYDEETGDLIHCTRGESQYSLKYRIIAEILVGRIGIPGMSLDLASLYH